MLKIYIVRHATAQDRGEALPDFERSLIKKGKKEAAAVAKDLALKRAGPDLMISSFANRAIETAHLFAKALGYPRQKILLRDTFYGSTDIEGLVNEIRKQPDKYRSLMLFGHDPAFSQLAAHLIMGFRETIPKAGVVTADFPASRWRDLESGTGQLVDFTGPALLKQKNQKARTDLEARLARSMEGVLARVSRTGTEAFREDIRKTARKTSKAFMKSLSERRPVRAGTRKPRAAG
jgi:phosphohistidine phosphatase